ncbi:MAG: phospholipase D family protein, partial [Anaerolineae bacterium]|nr:phospholipase D family protein [Anaerolineae bacterium]
NNNAILIRSADLARNYQAEFAEMFEQGQFGPRSPRNTPLPEVTVDGALIETYFSPEDRPADEVLSEVAGARRSIRFMAFSFTDQALAQAMIERARAGVEVSGVIERRGSETEYGQLRPLREAGIAVLTDGNPYVMHHKVIVIDEETVITGSYNFSQSAARDNDENVLIIHSADVARLYLEEFERVRQRAASAEP